MQSAITILEIKIEKYVQIQKQSILELTNNQYVDKNKIDRLLFHQQNQQKLNENNNFKQINQIQILQIKYQPPPASVPLASQQIKKSPSLVNDSNIRVDFKQSSLQFSIHHLYILLVHIFLIYFKQLLFFSLDYKKFETSESQIPCYFFILFPLLIIFQEFFLMLIKHTYAIQAISLT
ncbi:unnamed protein product [Paramecium primaurelia]|uniref:Transmembrane protein n=1 Tax=Paramecium primaurelia TaxID=5886 RepID=A0A8S1K868_PARPR|nr:unnamed protein product [Paramecium primaurelia]